MTTARRLARLLPPLALPPLAVLLLAAVGPAADGPAGKIVSEVVPLQNRLRPKEHILANMHTRAGKPYDEATVQEDVRRLHATKWFVPGGVQVSVRPDGDGRVMVFVHVTEVTSNVQDVQYIGMEHMSRDDAQGLTGVRKGDPMNPVHNEMGRQSLLKKYQEDGRYFASVELLEGGKATDSRVVYRIVEGPVVRVGGFKFTGNEHAATGRLKTQIMTSKAFAGFIGGKFNPMSLDVDRQKLTDYYHGLGYLKAQVFPEVVPSADLQSVTVVYHIQEGAQYTVAGRQIDGNKTFPAGALDPLMQLKTGERYDRNLSAGTAELLKAKYGNRGYFVNVEEKVFEVPGQPNVVNVHYEVVGDRGVPDRVGQIKIRGNDVTQDRVILNQLDLLPGQILQYPKLEDARIRLARLGIFDPENPPQVLVEQTEFDSQFKDIVVQVGETRTGQFMVGAGVNSNAGLNGSIVINERNFDLFRFPTSWDDIRYGRAFRGAGQELRLEAVPGTQFQRYSATFREPYLFDSQYALTNSAYYFNRLYAEYTEDRYGDRLSIDRRLDAFWAVNGSLRVEGVNIRDVPWYAPPSITDDRGQSFVLGLRAGLKRDSRDSYIYPTSGSVFDAGVEQVLGDYQFPIATAEFTQFLSTRYLQREDGSGKHVLAIRSQVSAAGGNAPVFERFFAGGFRSLRGFAFRGVGPNQNTLFTGGTFAFLNTIEYQVPILANDKMHFVTFLDHGTVEEGVSIRDYRVAAGFGFRIAIPALGPLPIALDFAFPLNKKDTDQTQLFSFYVGLFGGPN